MTDNVPVLGSERRSPSVFAPVFVPVSVSVREPLVGVRRIVPPLLKLIAPLPDASRVAPDVPIVNSRSDEVAAPVYCSVPPSITRLPATLLDAPIELFDSPFARVFALRIPPLIVVTPE